MKDKYIIMPDIHGRRFWKKPLEEYSREQYPDMRFIFLGDYLDPYFPYEKYTKEDAFVNFEEILDTARQDDRIILLLGNHDWHYIFETDVCRIDFTRKTDIRAMFVDNIDLFRFAYMCEDDNGKKYLFTHAGVTNGWLKLVDTALNGIIYYSKTTQEIKNRMQKILQEFESDKPIEEKINGLLDINDSSKNMIIDMVSFFRGGRLNFGSFIWADAQEHEYKENELPGYYQIFGHTITYPDGQYSYKITDNWAMIDASQAFVLETNGEIKPY